MFKDGNCRILDVYLEYTRVALQIIKNDFTI